MLSDDRIAFSSGLFVSFQLCPIAGTSDTTHWGCGKNIPAKVLTEQLKELEKDGLILRKVYNEIPRRVEYLFSELANSLSPVFDEIADWGRKHLPAKT